MKNGISFKDSMFFSLKGALYITKEVAKAIKNGTSIETAFIRAHIKLSEVLDNLYCKKEK
ncbi:MAG: hypothetical protein LBK26_03575 [Rickettsiales bacterium]|jgi:hypothetical protein|nr:hypothetical protein [Rickettsiales bacterium]